MARTHSPQLRTLISSTSLSPTLLPKASSLTKCTPFVVPPRPLRPRNVRSGVRSLSIQAKSGPKENQATTSPAHYSSQTIKVKGYAYVKDSFVGLSWTKPLDDIADLRGMTFLIELVSNELDPNTGFDKARVADYARRVGTEGESEKYECEFDVPEDFGPVGAVLVQNQHHTEMFLQDIVIELPTGTVNFACSSWIHPKNVDDTKRVFFSTKSYLPSKTPEGLQKLREYELRNLQGLNRKDEGEFKKFERIYDYDKYNDLGDPDKDEDLKRPVLGGEDLPYPRRCKTGREHSREDPRSEQQADEFYVPRDEEFSGIKGTAFNVGLVKAGLPAVLPFLDSVFIDPDEPFPHFKYIDMLYEEGIKFPNGEGLLATIPKIVKAIAESGDDLLQFDAPFLISRDHFSWLRDEEFARQTLAGLNPYSIQLVQEWPLKSKLDPKIYGEPAESLITTKLVEEIIGGVATIQQALEQKRLFMLDYHDIFLPYVNKIRQLEGTTMYGSRTLFFLNEDCTLRPIAIELTRPPDGKKPQWRKVYTPAYDGTGIWLWRLAKAHVVAHDAGYHQLIVHWLRTHCCIEPYVIAANRQMSAMHPIYRLLHPHFRYTMEINARARKSLINAGGIIESTFSPAKYSMEISAVIYDQLWRFDMEGLPADLIRRGMAEEDSNAEHGLKLAIKDYPFANDGLILWDAIKQWVRDYVNHYYPEPNLVESDKELQGWWNEVRNIGHGDKKDEPWWPVLKSQEDLIKVLTTIIWVASGHHAAVNFGQYVYGGYIPNRPTIARRNMPTEDYTTEEFEEFLESPHLTLLKTFPSQRQATQVMATLDLLSSHSPDEEYIGAKPESSWAAEPAIYQAFERFKARLLDLDAAVNERNNNRDLKNRAGAGILKYELLRPFSESGVTGRGVPNSVSI